MKFKTKRNNQTAKSTGGTRCALCYKWPKMIGAVSMYVPKSGGDPVPYTLCTKCVDRVKRNPNNPALLQRIEEYILDQATPTT